MRVGHKTIVNMSTIINERYNSIADFKKSLERKKIGEMYDENNEYVFDKDFCGTSTHKVSIHAPT